MLNWIKGHFAYIDGIKTKEHWQQVDQILSPLKGYNTGDTSADAKIINSKGLLQFQSDQFEKRQKIMNKLYLYILDAIMTSESVAEKMQNVSPFIIPMMEKMQYPVAVVEDQFLEYCKLWFEVEYEFLKSERQLKDELKFAKCTSRRKVDLGKSREIGYQCEIKSSRKDYANYKIGQNSRWDQNQQNNNNNQSQVEQEQYSTENQTEQTSQSSYQGDTEIYDDRQVFGGDNSRTNSVMSKSEIDKWFSQIQDERKKSYTKDEEVKNVALKKLMNEQLSKAEKEEKLETEVFNNSKKLQEAQIKKLQAKQKEHQKKLKQQSSQSQVIDSKTIKVEPRAIDKIYFKEIKELFKLLNNWNSDKKVFKEQNRIIELLGSIPIFHLQYGRMALEKKYDIKEFEKKKKDTHTEQLRKSDGTFTGLDLLKLKGENSNNTQYNYFKQRLFNVIACKLLINYALTHSNIDSQTFGHITSLIQKLCNDVNETLIKSLIATRNQITASAKTQTLATVDEDELIGINQAIAKRRSKINRNSTSGITSEITFELGTTYVDRVECHSFMMRSGNLQMNAAIKKMIRNGVMINNSLDGASSNELDVYDLVFYQVYAFAFNYYEIQGEVSVSAS